jgi:diketogulonate reductase-like aldo/keto reductase
MTVQGRQQQLQSSVLMQLHLPPWGLTMDPAADEMEEVVEAGIVMEMGVS